MAHSLPLRARLTLPRGRFDLERLAMGCIGTMHQFGTPFKPEGARHCRGKPDSEACRQTQRLPVAGNHHIDIDTLRKSIQHLDQLWP